MNQEALGELREFERLTEDNLAVYARTASMYRRLDMPNEERQILEAWASEAPGSVDVHRALGQFYARTGDKPLAVAEYSTVAQLAPDSANAHRQLAGAYQQVRRYDDAQQELVLAMNLQPENMAVRIQLGKLYRQSGDIEAATQTYYGIINDSPPDSTEARQAQRAINTINRTQKPKPKAMAA